MNRGSKIDSILTVIFMMLALATLICFFWVTDRTAFLACGGVAVVFRLIQYVLRFIH